MADAGEEEAGREKEMSAIMAQNSMYNAGAKRMSGPGRARKGQSKPKQGRRGSFFGRMKDPTDIREQGNARRSSLSIDRPQNVFDPGSIQECVKTGTLLVRVGPPNPRLKKWRKRHYMLTGCVLHCFADESADRQMNEDNIETAKIELAGNSSQKFSFSLRTGNQSIELAASSADSKAEWIAAFESQILGLHRGPVIKTQILLQAGGSLLPVTEGGSIEMAENPMASTAGKVGQRGIQSTEGALRIQLGDGDRLVLLMSSTGAKLTVEQQDELAALLDTLRVAYDKIDGASNTTAKLRNNLFVVSGKWAVYPQLFVLHRTGIKYVMNTTWPVCSSAVCSCCFLLCCLLLLTGLCSSPLWSTRRNAIRWYL
jgi:hypothetical protein